MQVPVPPPGFPGVAPEPGQPRLATLRALPQLVAPVWAQQPNEDPRAFQAFVAWLQRGPRGDWSAAERVSAIPRAVLESVATHWAWETRSREYWAHVRQVAFDAAQPLRDQLRDMQAQRARTHALALELEELEVRKLLHLAKGTQGEGAEGLPSQLDVRALARIRQVNASVSEQLRRESQGLPAEVASAGADAIPWERLTDDEAEHYRELRSKTGMG